MPGPVRSNVAAASRPSRKRAGTSSASSPPTARGASNARITFACAFAIALALQAVAPCDARILRAPSVRALLGSYARAIADPDAPAIAHAQTTGTLSGEGSTGAFSSWQQGDDERTDETLGPRVDRTLRLGDRSFEQDANGDVRRLTGVLARRDRTQRFIDSSDFAKHPERCTYRGTTFVGSTRAYVLDVAADDGDTERLYLDAATALPVRIAYDDDDGTTTVDLSDWRSIGGRRFPFRSVTSDGDHAFDLTQTTTSISLDVPIAPEVFSPFGARTIDMSGSATIALDWNEGHLYAPVTIAGHRYLFLIDTGAQDIVLDARVAAQLDLHPEGAIEASGATRTGGLRVARLAELDVGAGRMHDLVVSTIDLATSTRGAFRIDGILGYPFFAQALVRIDIANRSMTFGPPGSFAVAGDRLPLTLDRSFPETDLRIPGAAPAPFIIDTGNSDEVLLYKPFVDRHAGIVPYAVAIDNNYGIGGRTRSYRSTLEQIDLGSTPIYHADTNVMLASRGAFADRVDAGNVGLGVLKNFVMTFDYANDALYLEHGADFDDGRLRV